MTTWTFSNVMKIRLTSTKDGKTGSLKFLKILVVVACHPTTSLNHLSPTISTKTTIPLFSPVENEHALSTNLSRQTSKRRCQTRDSAPPLQEEMQNNTKKCLTTSHFLGKTSTQPLCASKKIVMQRSDPDRKKRVRPTAFSKSSTSK